METGTGSRSKKTTGSRTGKGYILNLSLYITTGNPSPFVWATFNPE